MVWYLIVLNLYIGMPAQLGPFQSEKACIDAKVAMLGMDPNSIFEGDKKPRYALKCISSSGIIEL